MLLCGYADLLIHMCDVPKALKTAMVGHAMSVDVTKLQFMALARPADISQHTIRVNGLGFRLLSVPTELTGTCCDCREFTRLNPKVTDIVFVATIKIILKPLVDKIPGFGECQIAMSALGT